MCFRALASIQNIEAPSSSALLVLYVLAEIAGVDGTCYPSQALLASRTQLSERAVRENLSRLRHAGLIAQVQRRRKDGSRTTDRFTLLYYTPAQAADTAASYDARKPGKDKEILPDAKRQISPPAKRQNATDQAAPAAGLTSFEPVIEPTTLRAPELAGVGRAGAPQGFPGEWAAVPSELRSAVAADKALGEAWCVSWLDPCGFDPAARTIHPRSALARGRIREAIGRELQALGMTLGEPSPPRRLAST